MEVSKINIECMINALTIKERQRILKNVNVKNDNIKLWKSIKSRLNDKQIEQMIGIRGLSHQEFNNTIQNMGEITDKEIIGKLCKEVNDSRWYKVFSDVMNRETVISDMLINWELTLLVMPFVNWGMDRITHSAKSLENISVDIEVISTLEQYLYQSVFTLAAKVSVYEYNKEKNKRQGEKYTIKSFVTEKLSNRERMMDFYYEYPVLARRLSVKIDFLSESIMAMLKNMDEKYVDIKKFYGISSSKITHIKCGSGDTHRQGKAVSVLTIGDTKLVYKPYKDELGKKYAEFIAKYNKYTGNVKIQTLKNMYFDTFTVFEYIENEECNHKQQVHCFYNRIGQLLFLLHMLGANDMHCENIIANGEHPMIVDFETLIGNYNYNKKDANAFDGFVKEFYDSIVNIGFLPVAVKGLQLGGLNNQGGTQSIEHEVIEKIDDENIMFKKKTFVLASNKNLPILNGEMQDFSNYASDIVSGFEHAFYIFKTKRKEVSAMLEIFKDSDARVVLQATQNYADIIDYSSHPKYLYDMLDMEKLFENIINPYHGVTEAILSEIDDLHNCDFPIFFVNSDDKNLYNYYGLCAEEYFKSTICENINYKMNNLDTVYLKQNAILLYYLKLDEVTNNAFWNMNKATKVDINKDIAAFQIKDKIENIRLSLEKRIDERIIVGEDGQSITWLSMAGGTMNCVFTDWRHGIGGLAKYIVKLQADGRNSILLDKYDSILKNMYLGKEAYWGDENIGLCQRVESELYVLNLYYAMEKSVDIEEKINIILGYLSLKLKNDNRMTALEIAGLINVLYETYELIDSYEVLKVMKKLGEMLLVQIRTQGYSGILEENEFHLGHALVALGNLYNLFSEVCFKEELEGIFRKFINDLKWNVDAFEIYGRKLTIESGVLFNILSSIRNIQYISKSDVKELYKKITEKTESKQPDNDTLRNGTCAKINCSILYDDYNQAIKNCKRLIDGYESYNEVKVVNSPLYPELGILDGYLGVLEVLLLVENIEQKI